VLPLADMGFTYRHSSVPHDWIFTEAVFAGDGPRPDAIVVGTHGSRGLERLLLGSVADKIVRGSRVPGR